MNRTILVSLVVTSAVFTAYSEALAQNTLVFDQAEYNALIDEEVSNSTLRSILKEIGEQAQGQDADTTTISGTVEGQSIEGSSNIPLREIPSLNSATVTINGRTVDGSTSASSFADTAGDDTLTIVVDGVEVFSGTVDEISEDDLLALFSRIGGVESNEVVQREVARATTNVTFRIVSQRISSFLSPRSLQRRLGIESDEQANAGEIQTTYANGTYGISAGDGVQRFGAWANFSYSFLDNTQANASYAGAIVSGLAGADYLVDAGPGQFLGGIAFGVEDTRLYTRFNDGTLDTLGFSVTPYAGYALMDGRLVFDTLVGYTWLDSDTTRNRSALKFSGDYDGHRIISGGNVTYNHSIDQFIISPSFGIQFAYEFAESFTDSANRTFESQETYIGDIKLGARVGYAPVPNVEIFTSHYWLYDTVPWFIDGGSRTDVDRDEVQSTWGATYFHDDSLEAGLEVTSSFFRNNNSDTAIIGNVRYTF